MFQVNPNEAIQIAYLISDMTDATVYFVRAVMRDTLSGATLGSVNLTRSGRRFTGQLSAPGHNGASALYVDITITPYTNAGYTVQATALPEIVNSYQVAYRWSQAIGGGGSGDPFQAVDPKLIVEALLTALEPRIKAIEGKTIEIPALPTIDLVGLRKGILEDISGHLKEQEQVRKSVARHAAKVKHRDELQAKLTAELAKLDEEEPEPEIPEALRVDSRPVIFERGIGEALASPEFYSTKRLPSQGVVSHLQIARNKAHSKKKPA